MAKIFPFRAYRYSPKAGPVDRLLTQPYDKITAEMQERYYAASPYNFARLTKGKEETGDNESSNVYTRAAASLDAWIAAGILEQDPEPAFYPYFQEFRHPDTNEIFVRKGFIGLTEVADYSAGIVYRHELTHSGPKLDRLQLTRHTRAHFGQLFMLYDDPAHAIDARLEAAAADPPLLSAEDEYGARHTLWKISDPAAVSEIREAMEPKKFLIADGHHRYETALAFARENPGLPGADKVMMTFVNMRAPGLVVLATHRVLDRLPDFDNESLLARAREFFDVEALSSAEELQRRIDSAGAETPALGAVLQGDPGGWLLTGKRAAIERLLGGSPGEPMLDVVVLHKVLLDRVLGVSEEDVRELKNIRYIRGFGAAVEEVRSGGARAAFLLRPVRADQVARIAFSGGVMPQKSTDFYPKLLSGLTIYRFG